MLAPASPDPPAVNPLARFRPWFLTVLICYWISEFVGTHVPKVPEFIEEVSDKTMHFMAYTGLALLLALTAASFRSLKTRHLLWLLLVIAIYATIDELLQIPVNRSASPADWAADMLGALVGLAAFLVLRGVGRWWLRRRAGVSRS